MRCLIIAKNPACSNAIKRKLRTSLVVKPVIHTFTAQAPSTPDWQVTDEFNRICDWIETKVCCGNNIAALRETVAITDIAPLHFGEGSYLNPLCKVADKEQDEEKAWSSLLALLILAFPEIQWVALPDPCDSPKPEPKVLPKDVIFRKAHVLDDLREVFLLKRDGFVPLFDPSGLRNRIRQLILIDPQTVHRDVPLRPMQAAAIDDEKSYTYLHAYTAYRFGFRSHVVTTEKMMSRLFSPDSLGRIGDKFLVFEDLFLKFAEPDAERERQSPHISSLTDRDRFYTCLRGAAYRIVVTSGHRRKQDQNILRDNRQYLKELRNSQHNRVLSKPLAGVFDLWEESGLDRKLERGLADGFVWPPRHTSEEATGGHSAPGRLLEVAARLIDRAERFLPEVRSVADCVHGAVLACDAYELLAERTPTSALEALMLKHQFEVLAECQFCGVQYSLEVKSRIEDIQREVKSLSFWFDPRREEFTRWNAEAAIVSKLIKIYREYNNFDEEQKVLARNRTLHRKMWFFRKRWAVIFQPLAWYIEWLLGSLPRFIVAMGLWVFVLSALYFAAGPTKLPSYLTPLTASLYAGFESFFGLTAPPGELGTFSNGVILLAISGGFVHLGVFISHLYTIVSRK